MARDDVLSNARSSIDYYALLSIPPTASPTEITRAYRRAALIHHPDKGGDRDKFELLEKAKDVLTDETAKAIYDQAIAAKVQKAKQNAAYEGQRKAMIDALEKGELEGRNKRKKPTREEDEREGAERRLIEGLLQKGKRIRAAKEEALRRAELESRGTEGVTISPIKSSTTGASTQSTKQTAASKYATRTRDDKTQDIDARIEAIAALIRERKAAAKEQMKADISAMSTPPRPKFASFASSPAVTPLPMDDVREDTIEKLRQAERDRLIAELKAQDAATAES